MIQNKSILEVFVGDSIFFANRWWTVIDAKHFWEKREVRLTLKLNNSRLTQIFDRSVRLFCQKGKGEIVSTTKSKGEIIEWLIKTKQTIKKRADLKQQKRRNKRKNGGKNELNS